MGGRAGFRNFTGHRLCPASGGSGFIGDWGKKAEGSPWSLTLVRQFELV